MRPPVSAEEQARRTAKMLKNRKRNAKLRAKGIHVPSKYKPRGETKKAKAALSMALAERDAHVEASGEPIGARTPPPNKGVDALAAIIVSVWRQL